jgi:hypothetical protein
VSFALPCPVLRRFVYSRAEVRIRRDFNIFVDDMTDNTRPDAAPAYQVALSPSNRGGGAMGTRAYSSKDAFVADLQQRLGYTDRSIERFFADPERHDTLGYSGNRVRSKPHSGRLLTLLASDEFPAQQVRGRRNFTENW